MQEVSRSIGKLKIERVELEDKTRTEQGRIKFLMNLYSKTIKKMNQYSKELWLREKLSGLF